MLQQKFTIPIEQYITLNTAKTCPSQPNLSLCSNKNRNRKDKIVIIITHVKLEIRAVNSTATIIVRITKVVVVEIVVQEVHLEEEIPIIREFYIYSPI